jgi:hypothetical protein
MPFKQHRKRQKLNCLWLEGELFYLEKLFCCADLRRPVTGLRCNGGIRP